MGLVYTTFFLARCRLSHQFPPSRPMNQYALALSLVSGFLAFPQSPTIKIRIDDPARISAEILWKAEKEAGALLESGGDQSDLERLF